MGFGGWPPIKGGLGGSPPHVGETGGVQGGLPPDRAILIIPRKENNIY